MGIIDSKKLNAALAKAKNIGLVEEACTIGGCDLVFRSLRSEDYTAVLQDCDGLPEDEYIHRYQKGHIARAIVEVNGVDLRDTQFVSAEELDPATQSKRAVRLELHQYLTQNMLNTWGKEVVDIAFRKLGDVLELAERRAKDGINFIAPDETAEGKYRRLLMEARATEKDIPGTLVERILDEHGMMRKSTAEEIKRAMSRTDQLAREHQALQLQDLGVSEPKVSEPKISPAAVIQGGAEPAEPSIQSPLIQPAPQQPRPVDPHRATLQSAIASRKTLDVPLVRSEPVHDPKPAGRASSLSALAAFEGGSQVLSDVADAVSLQSGDPSEVVEIKRVSMDAQVASVVVDPSPTAGINPRFRPPQKA